MGGVCAAWKRVIAIRDCFSPRSRFVFAVTHVCNAVATTLTSSFEGNRIRVAALALTDSAAHDIGGVWSGRASSLLFVMHVSKLA